MREKDIFSIIVKSVRNHVALPHYTVFLFGSRAEGHYTNRSDYDIGIKADKKIPPHQIEQIREEIDKIRILQKIDIVDFKRVSSDFSNMALKESRLLYEQ